MNGKTEVAHDQSNEGHCKVDRREPEGAVKSSAGSEWDVVIRVFKMIIWTLDCP